MTYDNDEVEALLTDPGYQTAIQHTRAALYQQATSGMDAETKQAFDQWVNANPGSSYADAFHESARLRGAPRQEPTGPDLTRRQTAGGGTPPKPGEPGYAAYIDAKTAELARRGR